MTSLDESPVIKEININKNHIYNFILDKKEGTKRVKEKFPETLLLFVTPPSATILKDRLVGRGTETMDVVEQRMKRAAEEAEGIPSYDYILVNDDLQTCVLQMHHIIQSEHFRTNRNREFIEQIGKELIQL